MEHLGGDTLFVLLNGQNWTCTGNESTANPYLLSQFPLDKQCSFLQHCDFAPTVEIYKQPPLHESQVNGSLSSLPAKTGFDVGLDVGLFSKPYPKPKN